MPEAGISARLWRPFEDSFADFRCLHLFGTAVEFLPIVESARRSGVKVLLTPETWREDRGRIAWAYPRGWLQRSRAWFHKSGRRILSRPPAWQRELYAAVDLLLPNSNVEAQRIARRFKFPLDRLRVIPHGVDPRMAQADPELFRRHAGVRDFVLYAGAIEPKNQQLGFLLAMKEVDVPLVIVGKMSLPSAHWYLDECCRVAGSPGAILCRRQRSMIPLHGPALLCGRAVAWSWETAVSRAGNGSR